MPNIEVQCTHCQAVNLIDAAQANQSLKCKACGKAYRLNPQPDKTLKRKVKARLDESGKPKEVLPVACPFCKQKFAIKLGMSGSTVACPVCQARLRFDIETPTEKSASAKDVPKPAAVSDQLPPKKKAAEPKPQTKQSPEPSQKPTTQPKPVEAVEKKKSTIESVDLPPRSGIAKTEPAPQATLIKKNASKATSDNQSELPPPLKAKVGQANLDEYVPQAKMLDEDERASKVSAPNEPAQAKSSGMLPPRYRVSEQDAESVAEEIKKDAPAGIELGIDTNLTRIESGGERIAVKSMTREEKQRRKTVRVAIMYTFGIAVLITVFWFLLKQSGE